jgi:ABC-type phosphate transport system auxiliary subunit
MIPAALSAILKPLLGSGLNLVANAVLAKGKDYVENKLGVELKPDMSSEDLAKIQIAQMEHEEELLKLRLEEDKLDLAELEARLKDTNDARQREVQIATSDKAPLINKIVTPILALSILLLTFVLFGVVMFDGSPVEASRKDILIYVLGVLSAIASQIVSYYFGSSVGSKDKTDALKEAIK